MTDSAMNTATAILSPWDSFDAAMDVDSLRTERLRPAHAIRRFADNMSHAKGDEAKPGEIRPNGSGRVRPIGRIRSIHPIVRSLGMGVKPEAPRAGRARGVGALRPIPRRPPGDPSPHDP